MPKGAIGKLAQVKNALDCNCLAKIFFNYSVIACKHLCGTAANHTKAKNGNIDHFTVLSAHVRTKIL